MSASPPLLRHLAPPRRCHRTTVISNTPVLEASAIDSIESDDSRQHHRQRHSERRLIPPVSSSSVSSNKRTRRVTHLAPDWHEAFIDTNEHENDEENDDDDDDDKVPSLSLLLEEDDPSIISTDIVLQRMEALAVRLVDCLTAGSLPVMTQWSRHHTNNDHDDDDVSSRTKRFTLQQCRSFTSILLVVSYCHALLCANQQSSSSSSSGSHSPPPKTVTTREVYYVYVTHFKSQRECNTAIAHACQLLQVPRHALGLQASARGWLCGDVTLLPTHATLGMQRGSTSSDTIPTMVHTTNSITNATTADGADGGTHMGMGIPIGADWLLPMSSPNRSFVVHPVTSARCIVLVEKEGVYQRLVQDRVPQRHGCICITAKGFPDWATRACVHALHTVWPDLPFYGLADCDPYGVAVLQCYARGLSSSSSGQYHHPHGSTTRNSGASTAIPVQWMGLRPSQVQYLSQPQSIAWNVTVNANDDDDSNMRLAYPALPTAVRQALTTRDVKLLRQFLGSTTSTTTTTRDNDDDDTTTTRNHPFPSVAFRSDDNDTDRRRQWQRNELKTMMESKYKVELEALYWLGMDFCAMWVGRLIDWHLQQHHQITNGHDHPDEQPGWWNIL